MSEKPSPSKEDLSPKIEATSETKSGVSALLDDPLPLKKEYLEGGDGPWNQPPPDEDLIDVSTVEGSAPTAQFSGGGGGGFSPFLPVLIVVLSLIFVYAYQISSILDQRRKVEESRAAIAASLEKARKVNDTLIGITQDLESLRDTSPAAQKILSDFQLKIQKKD